MATTVTRVIDPDSGSGYDYDSLYDWEAAQQGDLTGVRDEIAVAKCRCTGGTADTTDVTIDGWTTSSTQYIKIWTDPSESYRHNGTWQTGNKYRLVLDVVYDSAFRIVEQYVSVIGLQMDTVGSVQSHCIGINTTATTSSLINIFQNIIKNSGGSGGGGSTGILNLEKVNANVINNIVYDFEVGIIVNYGATATTVTVFNNTVVDCSLTGISNYSWSGLSSYIYNNIVQGTSSDGNYQGSGTGTGTNISEDATSPDTAFRSKTVQFVAEASDNFHLASSDTVALGLGTNLYNNATYPFQTDIDGQDRGGSGYDWDIGADEYIAAAGGSIVPVLLRQYRARRV